jgi:hypothetical protein
MNAENKLKRVLEVSEAKQDPETKEITFLATRYDHQEDGSVKVESFGEETVLINGEPYIGEMYTNEQLLAYGVTLCAEGEVDEVVLTEKQTVGQPDSGIITDGIVEEPILAVDLTKPEDATAEEAAEAAKKQAELEASQEAAKASANVVAEPVKMYAGKKVISDSTREVEGKVFHSIKLEDGTAHDLTPEEYAAKVIVQA